MWGVSVYDYLYLLEKNLIRVININMKKILDGYFYYFKVNFFFFILKCLIFLWCLKMVLDMKMKKDMYCNKINEEFNYVIFNIRNCKLSLIY